MGVDITVTVWVEMRSKIRFSRLENRFTFDRTLDEEKVRFWRLRMLHYKDFLLMQPFLRLLKRGGGGGGVSIPFPSRIALKIPIPIIRNPSVSDENINPILSLYI